ncbi:Holliday junction ATP-dependent DNA helicase RuvA [Alteracholeplasma palmae J233]|uniref:Holliday junction branch migration complex subunit RuvA n=1 Tax=Alteracholeplasma palmae (strain ATCC 49389 / J233) TaxID=1318466 RepID=U4KPC3_ALTPJ|nr:Holliday junction branch migration protein RuvA [Alteracholeplasma palmae]CCV64075.1 Holliday junction ATP-dependent DNA helicase RuvA [Alteracholeplasma palmae J233]
MYGYIKGKITKIVAEYIIVENNGIGYQIISPSPYDYEIDDEVVVFTYLHVREDIFLLYGFKDTETLDLFKKLLSVSGIGPKSALSIVAASNSNDVLNAIENGDVKYLTKFPGIGNKSAQQIILDLKGKLIVVNENKLIPDIGKDVSEALLALGYSKVEIAKAIKHINLDQKIELAVKEALVWLLK